MGTIGAPASLLRCVHLDVLNDKAVRVEVLELGIALGIL
eukprot:CAMPEP_0180636558 /NCGR_PEP_ID=MMETSP1037_2-20121125/43222_1 /TAXON_ID=632150 /ORGANISM="Azadinium spinosum, Strain 3D9" /LENGTH=38 /DNA_ID= /DNA_START= /DNA_END= /DNA_ORIENTATION=